MSRLKGFAAAGLHILNTKPALLTKYGRVLCLLMAGPIILTIGISSLVGVAGSSIPVPPRKPDMATLMPNGGFSNAAYSPAARSTLTLEETPYRSPFSGPQMDLYRDIFRLQAAGSLADADVLIARLTDKSLMGHVLAQRYINTSYKASFAELENWLTKYADHPQADRIAKLANARTPSGHKGVLTKVS